MGEPVRFGEGEPFTLGVEEELFLADPGSGRLLNASEDVLEELGPIDRGEVGVGLIGSGTHPTGEEGEAEITDSERYELMAGCWGMRSPLRSRPCTVEVGRLGAHRWQAAIG